MKVKIKLNLSEVLGIEEFEDFNIVGSDSVFRIEEGLMKVMDEEGKMVPCVIGINNLANMEIIKKPKFPRHGECYYYITQNGEVGRAWYHAGSLSDILNYKVGNYFTSKSFITDEIIQSLAEWLNDSEQIELR